MRLTKCLFLSAVLAGLPALAPATSVTLDSPTANFSNAAGGSNVTYSNGATHSEVRWGVPESGDSNKKSGLGFDVFNAPLDTSTGTAFNLGTLTHYNWPINSGTAASSVKLAFTFTIADPNLGNFTFDFPFAIDETANSPPCAETPHPADNYCPDIISFPNTSSTESFSIGDVDYTLYLLGFGTDASHLTNQFITQEGQDNSAFLWGKIDSQLRSIDVPEPNALLMMALGLLTLGGALQLRRKYG